MKSFTFPSVSSKHILPILSGAFAVNLPSEQLLQLIKDLCSRLSARHQKNLLECLLSHVRLDHLTSLRISACLHTTGSCSSKVDCYDFITWLPMELVLHIFSFLPLKSLIHCSLVNRTWLLVSRHPDLYRRLCALPEWSPPPFKLEIPPRLSPALPLPPPSLYSLSSSNSSRPCSEDVANPQGNVDWYHLFKSRFRLRSNWLLGRHRIRKFTGHNETVHCVAYDTHRIASGSADATIRIWNVRTNANWSVQTLRGHSDAVRCLQLLTLAPSVSAAAAVATGLASSNWQPPPDALLISGSSDTTIKVWRVSAYDVNCSRITCIETFQGHTETVRCLKADQEQVVSGSYDCSLRRWSLHSGHLQRIYRGHSAGIICLTYDNEWLYSGSLDNTVRVWCLNSGACRYSLQCSVPSPLIISSLYLDPIGRRLLIAHHYGAIFLWHLPVGSPHACHCDCAASLATCNSPAMVPLTARFGEVALAETMVRCIAGDAWHIVCGCDDKTLKVWRTDTNQLVSVLKGHEDGVTCLAIGSSVVVSGSYDKSILLYDFGVT